MDTKHSDSGSRRGYENSGQISDQTDRQKPKLQKARRLSSGGMVRAQKKRRTRRANTLPDLHSMAANGPAVEDKRKAAKPGDEAQDSRTQLLNQTPEVVNRTGENEEFDRETAFDETQSSMAHPPPSRAESTVTATWPAPSLTDEFYASEIGRNHNNGERDATNFCSSDGNQPSEEPGSPDSDLLFPSSQSTSEAQAVDTSQELQSEGLAGSTELKMGTVDISADCDIVPPKKNKVHQSDSNREEIMVLSTSARRRWSIPTTLDHFETSTLCGDSTNGEFIKRHDSSLGRADGQIGTQTAPRKRSISLPLNNFVVEKSDDFLGPPRLPATKVTKDLQCTDNSFDCEKTTPVTLLFEKNRTKVGRSKSWPSTLIYLEVSSKKSNSQRNDDSFRSKSLSSLENIDNTRFIEERLTKAHANSNPAPKVAEKSEQIEDKKVTEKGETSSRQHSRGKSRSFTFSKEKHVMYELNGSSYHQASNTNKFCLRRSKSLPSVLSGSAQASTVVREIPHSSREIDPAETAPKVGEVGAAGGGCPVHPGECHMGASTTVNPSHTTPIKQASKTNGMIEHHTTTFKSQENLLESEQERHTISAMESEISMGTEEEGVHARSEELPTSHESHARGTEDHLPSHANEITESHTKSPSGKCEITDDHDTRHAHGAAEPHQGTQESHSSHASEIGDHTRTPESKGARADGKSERRMETPKFQPSREDNSGNAESLKTHLDEEFELHSGLTESEPSHGDESQDQSRDLASQPSHANETSEFYKRTMESQPGCEVTEGQTPATEAELLHYGDNTTELCAKTPGAQANQAKEGAEPPSEISVSQLKRESESDNTSGTPESSHASEATALYPGTSESQDSDATAEIGDHSKYLEQKQGAESQPIQLDEATEGYSAGRPQEPSYEHDNEDHTSKAASSLSHANDAREHHAGTAELQMSHEGEITEDHTSTTDSTPSHANDAREHHAVTTEPQLSHESEMTEGHTSTPDSTPSHANDAREHHAVTTEPQLSHEGEITEVYTSTPDSTPSHANNTREQHAGTAEPQLSHESEMTESHTSTPDSTPSHANDARERHAGTAETQLSHEGDVTEGYTSTPDSTPSHANDAREHHAGTAELQMNHEGEITEGHISTPDSTPGNARDAREHHAVATESQLSHEGEITEDQTSTLDSTPRHANDAREHHAVTTEPQLSHDDKTTEDHISSSDSTPGHANDKTEHHMVTTKPTLISDNEITECIASSPQSLPGDANGIEDRSRTTSESQPSLAANSTEDNIRTPELSQCSDGTKHEDQPELACGSVSGLTRYSRRRPRSFTLPHIMESIVEVPNEQAEEADSGTMNPSDGVELAKAYKRGCRSHTLGSIGRSHSVDFGNFRQDSDALTPDHEPDTCTSELQEKLMLGADDIELTVTDVFEADATSRALTNEHISGGADREENFDPSISKFDSILSSVVSSFLEPDYTSSSSSLHRAVAKGDLGKVKRLIERGANVDVYDEHGLPALHVAVVSGDYDMAECLLEAGADLRVYTETLIQEYTTLKQLVCYNL